MAMSRDVVLRLLGDATSAKRALQESAQAAGVTATEYKRAETLQRQQAAAAKKLAAEQAAAAQVVGSSMLGMGTVIVGALGLATAAAVQWESSFADVKKVMKDPTMFGTVEAQLRALTSVLPVTHQEIAAVAAAAAQLGVADADIADFTKSMIMLGTTTNLTSEEAATAIARISNIMGTATADADNLGSAIVYLGNNFATTESEIVAMSLRLAGAGKQAGMTEADVLGMSAAFSSVGIEAEAGGTAISKFMTDIGNSVRDGGDKLDQFAKLAGTSATEFAKKWKSDPAAAMAAVVSGLGDMQKAGGDINGTLDQLGITEMRMRDALLRSAGAGDLLTQAITGSNEAFAEGTALQDEAATRYETTASQLQLMKNGIVEAGISVGQALLPPLNLLVDVIRFVVDGFNSLPGPVQGAIGIMLGLVGASALVGGGILNMTGRVKELSAAFATMKTADGFMGKMGGFMGMLGPAAGIIGLVTLAVSALSSMFGGGASYVKDYTGYVDQMSAALKESNGAIDANVRALAAKALADEEVEGSGKSLIKALDEMGVSLPTVTDALLGNQAAYDQVIAAIDKYIAANDGIGYDENIADATMAKEKITELASGMKDAADKSDLMAKASGEATDANSEQAAAADAAGMSTEDFAQAQAEAADAAEDTKQAVDALKDAFDQLNGANLDMLEATADMTLALAGMGDAIESNGTSLDASTESGAKNVQMLADLVGTAEDVVTATLQQTGSVEQAKAAYDAQRQSIIDNAAALGLNKDQVAALLDQIFQMPSELITPVETPGASDALSALESINAEAYEASNGSVQIKAEALTDDAIAQLESLGLKVEKMPNGKDFLITAQTEDAQAGLDAIIQKSGLVDETDPSVDISADGNQALQALTDVGAKVEMTPDGKQIVIESLTEDAQQQLEDVGFVVSTLPDGRKVVVSAPGAIEAKSAIDGTNAAAQNLSNGEAVEIVAPGAVSSTGQINATNQAAIQLSNGEQVPISAPGATTATKQVGDFGWTAKNLPASKHTEVTASTEESKLWGFKNALDQIKSKTVYVTTITTGIGASVNQADGGQVKFYAAGGEHHVAQYARAGTWRVWAEPETGGEWYIPDALAKRPRSLSIAQQMVDGWGMQIIPKGAQQYAYGSPLARSSSSSIRHGDTYNIAVTGVATDTPEDFGRKVVAAIKDHQFLYGKGGI